MPLGIGRAGELDIVGLLSKHIIYIPAAPGVALAPHAAKKLGWQMRDVFIGQAHHVDNAHGQRKAIGHKPGIENRYRRMGRGVLFQIEHPRIGLG